MVQVYLVKISFSNLQLISYDINQLGICLKPAWQISL